MLRQRLQQRGCAPTREHCYCHRAFWAAYGLIASQHTLFCCKPSLRVLPDYTFSPDPTYTSSTPSITQTDASLRSYGVFLVDDSSSGGNRKRRNTSIAPPLSYPTRSTDPIVSRYNDAPVHGHRRAEPPKRQISRSPARSHRSTSVPFAHTLSLSFHPPSPPFSYKLTPRRHNKRRRP